MPQGCIGHFSFGGINVRILLLPFIAALSLVACDEPPDPRRTNFEIRKENITARYDPKTGRLKTMDEDVNKNGKMDTFSFWDGTRLDQIQIDSNEDGKIDRWEHYGPEKKLLTVGSSSRGDGIEDTLTWLPDAEGTVRVDTDEDRDGVIDKREFLSPRADGTGLTLRRAEMEFDKDGNPHRRLYYGQDGSFERTEAIK